MEYVKSEKEKKGKRKMPGKLLKEVLSLLEKFEEGGVNREEFARVWAQSELELPAYGRVTLEGGCKGVVSREEREGEGEGEGGGGGG